MTDWSPCRSGTRPDRRGESHSGVNNADVHCDTGISIYTCTWVRYDGMFAPQVPVARSRLLPRGGLLRPHLRRDGPQHLQITRQLEGRVPHSGDKLLHGDTDVTNDYISPRPVPETLTTSRLLCWETKLIWITEPCPPSEPRLGASPRMKSHTLRRAPRRPST